MLGGGKERVNLEKDETLDVTGYWVFVDGDGMLEIKLDQLSKPEEPEAEAPEEETEVSDEEE